MNAEDTTNVNDDINDTNPGADDVKTNSIDEPSKSLPLSTEDEDTIWEEAEESFIQTDESMTDKESK